MTDIAGLPRTEEDWRAVRALNLYRWVVAVALCVLLASGYAGKLFTLREPATFTAACIVYLLTCLPAALAVHQRRPPLDIQVYLLAGTDIGFVTLLVFASAGIDDGLGMLLLAPIAGASLLVSRRTAALFAAVGSLCLILQEIYGSLRFPGETAESVQAGILGMLLFVSALVANGLATRARTSADLAERRKTALDDLATLNDRVIQQMAMGLVLVDEERRVRLLNRAARVMLDLHPIAVGQPLTTVVPPLARSLRDWLVSPSLSTKPVTLGQRALLPRFNRLGPDANAPVLIFLEDARQISEQAQQMKLAALGRLTASIAHEIRNPLSAINQAGQLLDESKQLGGQERHLLDIVHRHTQRIDNVVQSVLGLSRRDQALPDMLRLAQWLPQAVADYRHGHPRSPCFDLSRIDDRVFVRADANHLRQILHNLWENAEIHARQPDTELLISMRAGIGQGGEPYLEVADNGPGIRDTAIPHLMEPFFTTSAEGTGLGLYIARELCECNFARIALINSRPAAADTTCHGARFRIIFASLEGAGGWQPTSDNVANSG